MMEHHDDGEETWLTPLAVLKAEWGRVDCGGGLLRSVPHYSPNSEFWRADMEYRTIVTFDRAVEFPFSSWQEEAPPALLPGMPAVCVTFNCRYAWDDVTTARLEEFRMRLLQEAMPYDSLSDVRVEPSVPGFIHDAHGAVNQGKTDRIRRVLATTPGYVIWTLCLLLGYQPILESFSRLSIGRHTVECSKRLSVQPGLRASYGERDETAAALAVDQTLIDRDSD
jgi:hypothetical protein